MHRAIIVLLVVSGLVACGRDRDSRPVEAEPGAMPSATSAANPGGTRKAVLIIGDGMDDQQITIARNYLVGRSGRLTLDGMPVRAAVQVETVAEDNPGVPDYVPDSANTATSMATGAVTSAGRIGTMAGTGATARSIMELAAQMGIGTGVVTTSSLTDATPASFVAHINQRLCEGPRNMVVGNARNPAFSTDCSRHLKANGGTGSIAEQFATSNLDIALGGGQQYFAQIAEGEVTKTVRDIAVERGFRVVENTSELTALAPGGRVLGLLAPSTLPVAWRGVGDGKAELVGHAGVRPVLPEPFGCEPNPSFAGMPRLADLTRAALAHLDDGRSFMLMVESASIDKQSHLRRPCGSIGELAQLDETLGIVLEYARAHPETLVLVTADHAHAAQLVPEVSALAAFGAASPGYFARVRTPEGGVMGVNYATNDSTVQEDHSGANVPLFAFGAGSERIPSFLSQTAIFSLLKRQLGLERG